MRKINERIFFSFFFSKKTKTKRKPTAALVVPWPTEETRTAPPTVDDDLAVLNKGSVFWKLRSSTQWFRRRYWLHTDRLRLCYEPSRKPFWSSAEPHGKPNLLERV